ncbi:14-3-3 protein gamma-2 [Echinococcus granulosus]|uniref:14-3-3 protein gamma n=1 Tax=Echinococcus granulosus TaxID=6210 RepID=U6JN49_ECHGR|nr:14-3-3 protein gamma-2 [Echinococcus granulosus]EUB56171.1 14-3-3 protein gamma-2 [Echinococcus granulosus]CDS24856.1 14-3-3 protein gamma [Echinococcus granulosus]
MTDSASALTEHNELARIYEVLELYSEMVKEVKAVVQLRDAAKEQLSMDERNRLSVAYKHNTGRLRTAWRATPEILSNARNFTIAGLVRRVRTQLKDEILSHCQEVIQLLEKQTVTRDEDGVFLLKMRGDYHRYQAEVDGEKMEHQMQAAKAYTEASKLAKDVLTPANSVRLGLSLNHSVFLFEIVGDRTAACLLAREALEQALRALDDADVECQSEVTVILQLLRDNLTIWTAEDSTNE